MSKKFKNIQLGAGLLNTQSKAIVNNDFKITYIPIENLIENDNNEGFSMDDIEELKISISEIGLEQNLVVSPCKENEKYKILSGHRRFKALKELVAEGNNKFNTVPCIIKDLNKIDLPLDNKTKELYAIATTNAEIRKNTDADKLKLLNMLSEVYDKLKENGYTKLGKRRDFIAERLGISASSVHRLSYIDKNLNDDIKNHFLEDNMSMAVATEISKMNNNEQEKFLDYIEEIEEVTIDDVKDFIDNKNINKVKNDDNDIYKYELSDITDMVNEIVADLPDKKVVLNKKQFSAITKSRSKIEKEINNIKKILDKIKEQ